MIFSGLMIPFLGTTLGAGMVFFMKGSMNQKLEKMLLGFAAGVMIAGPVILYGVFCSWVLGVIYWFGTIL